MTTVVAAIPTSTMPPLGRTLDPRMVLRERDEGFPVVSSRFSGMLSGSAYKRSLRNRCVLLRAISREP